MTCNLHAARPALDGQGTPALVEGHDGLAVDGEITAASNVCLAHVWADVHNLPYQNLKVTSLNGTLAVVWCVTLCPQTALHKDLSYDIDIVRETLSWVELERP